MVDWLWCTDSITSTYCLSSILSEALLNGILPLICYHFLIIYSSGPWEVTKIHIDTVSFFHIFSIIPIFKFKVFNQRVIYAGFKQTYLTLYSIFYNKEALYLICITRPLLWHNPYIHIPFSLLKHSMPIPFTTIHVGRHFAKLFSQQITL